MVKPALVEPKFPTVESVAYRSIPDAVTSSNHRTMFDEKICSFSIREQKTLSTMSDQQ
jgi:hypothetical protein